MSFSHTFAVCAYKESEYLESCIKSLLRQTVKTDVIVCTSTPCDFIENMAKKYNLPYYVREGKSDIQDDWNFACDQATTEWVTVAHQDDVYSSHYVELVMAEAERYTDAILAFTDYRPLKNGKKVKDINCFFRHLFRMPLKSKWMAKTKFFKKASLSLGNTICCPAVTYNKAMIKDKIFTSDLKFSLDWDTFYKFANGEGRFLYIDKPLTYYRIHDGATTKEFILDHRRVTEDTIMFNKFWPKWVTKIIMKFYVIAYRTYGK